MKSVVVDTDILIDYSKGYADWLGEMLCAEKQMIRFIVPTIVITEYFASHILENPDLAKAADDLFLLFHKQDLTEEIAKILAGILRRKTYTASASLADLIIASTALYLDAPLATRNVADFRNIPTIQFFEMKG